MDIVGAVAMVLLVSVIATPVLSVILLRIYRGRVQRWMSARVNVAGAFESHRGGAPAPLRLEIINPARFRSRLPLVTRLYQAPWLLATAYTFAGLAHTLLMTMTDLKLATGGNFSTAQLFSVLLIHSWALIPPIFIICVSSRRAKLIGMPLLFLALMAGAWFIDRGLPLYVLIRIGVPALFTALVANRWIKSIGPIIFIGTAGVVGGVLIAGASAVEASMHAGSDVALVAGAIAAFLVSCTSILAIVAIARFYEQKRISDQSLLLDTHWAMFSIWGAAQLAASAAKGGLDALLCLIPLLAFAVYKAFLAVLLVIINRATQRHECARLLLLRVFGSQHRSERLLESIGRRWRYIGPIQLIAAPDVATINLDPADLYRFLTFRTRSAFVANLQDLARRLHNVDEAPDPDGRYRINDFFCHEDTWRMTLDRLVGASDVVLVDVRGFRARNEGVSWELARLFSRKSLDSVILLGDSTTAIDALERAIQVGWEAMDLRAPNRANPWPAIRLVRASSRSSLDARGILAILCEAAVRGGNAIPVTDRAAAAHV